MGCWGWLMTIFLVAVALIATGNGTLLLGIIIGIVVLIIAMNSVDTW